MKTKETKKTIYAVQGQLNGGKFYDISAHKTYNAANRVMSSILKKCYPKWRGMDLGIRMIKRIETVTVDSEIIEYTCTPQGKVRSRLAEIFIPSWLPKPIQAKLKELPIP